MRVGNYLIKWNYNGLKTTCTVETVEKVPVAESTVTKYATDISNKRLARKLAFERTMKAVIPNNLIPKQDRSAIWSTFREKINQPIV